MSSSQSKAVITLTTLVLVVLPIVIWAKLSLSAQAGFKSLEASQYDDLTKCLAAKNVRMYGAYWCTHCQAQKKAFGSSWQYVKYIECSLPAQAGLPGGKGQTQECNEAGIKGYPTWDFGNGERLSGEVSLEQLAEKSGCSTKINYLQVGNTQVAVEVRDTEEGRSQGLSGREQLGEDEGMLFIFDQPGIYGFWMKDMKFPLDFIWIKDNAVAEIRENVGIDQMDIRPKEAADKVLEVNSGWVEKQGIKVGDAVK